MIAELKPYAEYRELGLPWFGLFQGSETINADIIAIEREAEGLPDGLLKGGRA